MWSTIRSLLYAVIIASICHLFYKPAYGNVLGSDTQNFNPTQSGIDFVTVHSTTTLLPGMFNFGLFVNYAVNTLPTLAANESESAENSSGSQSRRDLQDSLTGLDINFAVGLFSFLELGLSFPQVLQNTVYTDNEEEERGQFSQNGITEIRVQSKWGLWHSGGFGSAFVLSGNFNQIENNPYSGQGAGPTVNYELVLDYDLKNRFVLGVNAGYRKRDPGEPIENSAILPYNDQYIASMAVSFYSSPIRSKIIMEFFGSWPVESSENVNEDTDAVYINDQDASLTSSEILLGIKHDLTDTISLHLGGGTELVQGAASPDWRAYLGVNLATTGFERDHKLKVTKIKDRSYTKKRQKALRKILAKRKPEMDNKSSSKPEDKEKAKEQQKMELPAKPQYDDKDFNFEITVFDGKPSAHEVIEVSAAKLKVHRGLKVPKSTYRELKKIVDHMKRDPKYKYLIVHAHTDIIGTALHNARVSKKRSEEIREVLIRFFKLKPDSIIAEGHGYNDPVASSTNFQGREQNRRFEFEIVR